MRRRRKAKLAERRLRRRAHRFDGLWEMATNYSQRFRRVAWLPPTTVAIAEKGRKGRLRFCHLH